MCLSLLAVEMEQSHSNERGHCIFSRSAVVCVNASFSLRVVIFKEERGTHSRTLHSYTAIACRPQPLNAEA